MSLREVIASSLMDCPSDWSIDEYERFLTNGDVRLVRNTDGKWRYIVGSIGYVAMPRAVQFQINWMVRGNRFASES